MLNKDTLLNINDEGIAFFTHSVKLTENIERTPEGFLICKNATFGRTGFQDYLGRELKNSDLGIDFKDKEVYKVYRDEQDVFNEVSRESANGKYLTINHPKVDVTTQNYKELGKGHIMGTPQRDGDNLVGDLLVSDPLAIELILSKRFRELSMGYKTKLVNDNGTIKQTNILYNHIALLERGRAGNSRINDNDIENMEDLSMDKTELLDKILSSSGNTITINIGDVKPEVKDEEKKKDEDVKTDDKDVKGKDAKENYVPEDETLDKKTKDEDKKDKEEAEEDKKDACATDEENKKDEDKKDKDKEHKEDKTMDKKQNVNDAMFGGVGHINTNVGLENQNNTSFTGNEMIDTLQNLHDSVSPENLMRNFDGDKERERHIYKMGAYQGSDFVKKGGF